MKNKKEENYVIFIDSDKEMRPLNEFKCPKCDHQLFHIDYKTNIWNLIKILSFTIVLSLTGYSIGKGYLG